ncbi:cytochrome-c peroxidase [Hymenobacter jeollabukensis]|uniref:Cytochrome-c peroxidase n=1 Tax=Hymenobacter jeollabukensis TaxID=2025313 RepID=A0A5R8WXM6_9BACT|nr:cytochrome c peroxidase [Hymenobacter jeollabukensis]TLM96954.1 cytochrome-c peroxidase [Hymenobacter jeollabukensis]
MTLRFTPFSVRRLAGLLAAGLFSAVVACQPDSPTPDAVRLAADNGLSALPTAVTAPPDNPSSAAKVELGRLLFWDPVLSGPRDVSCASCHHPASGYTDALDLSIGPNGQGQGSSRHFRQPNDLPFAQRNAPTVLNVAFNGIDAAGHCDPGTAAMFWDSRAHSLEAQTLLPLATLAEMRGRQFPEAAAVDSVVARLRRIQEYQQRFGAVFGGAEPVTAANLGRALACFERSLTATDAPYDRYLRGDHAALTDEQVQGLTAFVQSGCPKCHAGPMFSDYQTHVLGVADNAKLAASDAGQNGTYAFRTPSLRQVAATAPYMHNGTMSTLAEVVRFYDAGPRGGRASLNPNVPASRLDALLPTRVTNQPAIVAFLGALSASSFDRSVPARVPSGLPVGGNL